MSHQVLSAFQSRKIQIDPMYKIKSKQKVEPDQPPKFTMHTDIQVEQSFEEFARLEVADDFKKSLCCTLEIGYDQKYPLPFLFKCNDTF